VKGSQFWLSERYFLVAPSLLPPCSLVKRPCSLSTTYTDRGHPHLGDARIYIYIYIRAPHRAAHAGHRTPHTTHRTAQHQSYIVHSYLPRYDCCSLSLPTVPYRCNLPIGRPARRVYQPPRCRLVPPLSFFPVRRSAPPTHPTARTINWQSPSCGLAPRKVKRGRGKKPPPRFRLLPNSPLRPCCRDKTDKREKK
jgi:hypothetical protein